MIQVSAAGCKSASVNGHVGDFTIIEVNVPDKINKYIQKYHMLVFIDTSVNMIDRKEQIKETVRCLSNIAEKHSILFTLKTVADMPTTRAVTDDFPMYGCHYKTMCELLRDEMTTITDGVFKVIIAISDYYNSILQVNNHKYAMAIACSFENRKDKLPPAFRFVPKVIDDKCIPLGIELRDICQVVELLLESTLLYLLINVTDTIIGNNSQLICQSGVNYVLITKNIQKYISYQYFDINEDTFIHDACTVKTIASEEYLRKVYYAMEMRSICCGGYNRSLYTWKDPEAMMYLRGILERHVTIVRQCYPNTYLYILANDLLKQLLYYI